MNYRREIRKLRRRDKISYARHHRLPRSRGGSNDESNISIVPRHLHQAWHTLFANHSPEVICAIINERWIPHNVEFLCQTRAR